MSSGWSKPKVSLHCLRLLLQLDSGVSFPSSAGCLPAPQLQAEDEFLDPSLSLISKGLPMQNRGDVRLWHHLCFWTKLCENDSENDSF